MQRSSFALDGQAQAVPATGGLWLTNKWLENPGPSLSNPNLNYLYGNLAVGINNYYPPPAGFIGSNVLGDGTLLGLSFGAPAGTGNFYVGYTKKTRGHYCIFAANNMGAVQFMRIPFIVTL